jgi:hypothetical protein
MLKFPFFLLLIIISGATAAQEIVNGKPLIRSLLSESTAVDDVWFSKSLKQPLAINDIPFLKGNGIIAQKLIRTKLGLFVLPEGTGRVYEIKRENEDISVHRVDSTIFFGYNFGAFSFSYQDTIYSFGGYGIWRYNGQLRVYLPQKHEWELIPLSKEVPFYSNATYGLKAWFDTKKGQLYVNKMPEKSMNIDSIYVLDMQSKKWSVKGKTALPNENFEGQINTPWGILCKDRKDYTSYIILDLKNNRILNLSEKKSNEIRVREQWNSIFFIKDSTLFTVTDSIYKTPLSITDFEITEDRIYELPVQTTFKSSLKAFVGYYWKFIIGMLLCILIGFVSANYLQKIKNQNVFGNGLPTKKNKIIIFDEKEKELIKLIFENSMHRKSTTIEDINQVLGLSNKPNDLQKKHRSDTISSINQKYQYLSKKNGLLLKKNRSDVDKRSFEYFIDYEDYKSLEVL